MPDVETPEVWKVSQLTRRVKELLEREINYVWLTGEISNFRVSPAGHAYFTLKDELSQIDAVMFRGRMMKLQFTPDSGLEVIVYGQVTVYERRGNYQIVCDEMHPKGVGALQLAFDKLKKKLQAEGLFDEEHKKLLPLLPKRIGIVTSPSGAAIRDILNVLHRRFANVHVLLYPARVQGEAAAADIVEGIRVLDAMGVDVMIVGRGGGSLEDLWPFNEESVVRAVYEAQTPIISAVGHEIDFALTDFAADLRAPTPSAAAELVVREQREFVEKLQTLRRCLAASASQRIHDYRNRMDVVRASYVFRRPEELIRQRRQRLDETRMALDRLLTDRLQQERHRLTGLVRSLGLLSPKQRLRRAYERLAVLRERLSRSGTTLVERGRARLKPLLAQLDALSPLAVLGRGYALAYKMPERAVVRDAKTLAPGDELALRFAQGGATASVKRIEESNDG
ncbi:MAG: exodeoxyribonuclease VII large subunit [Candidatus Hydrogenedentes bacterium]|nr:exodeoxyribonuclease VII large subunit [Candidatus Hydrogenedentota bacterium]